MYLPAREDGRALEVAVWYPAGEGRALTLVGDNPVFVGFPVAAEAPAAPGRHPLVVLSHGYGGNWTNQMWLALELVRRGYVVAAPNHPGTTSSDMRSPASASLWERPRDIGRVVDALITDASWAVLIDPGRIAVVGHSLGGWTALALAGGRFDPGRFEADCQSHGALAACRIYKEIGIGQDAAARAALGQSRRDGRVAAVISFDLGFARGFDPASLAAITIPVLVVAAGPHTPDMPAALESRYLAGVLPAATSRYEQIDDAAHFSFLPVCKPGAAALLKAGRPAEAGLCEDGGGRDRAVVHAQVANMVAGFLSQGMPGN